MSAKGGPNKDKGFTYIGKLLDNLTVENCLTLISMIPVN